MSAIQQHQHAVSHQLRQQYHTALFTVLWLQSSLGSMHSLLFHIQLGFRQSQHQGAWHQVIPTSQQAVISCTAGWPALQQHFTLVKSSQGISTQSSHRFQQQHQVSIRVSQLACRHCTSLSHSFKHIITHSTSQGCSGPSSTLPIRLSFLRRRWYYFGNSFGETGTLGQSTSNY